MYKTKYSKLYENVLKVDPSLKPLISYISNITYTDKDFKRLIENINQSPDDADKYKKALINMSLPYCVYEAYKFYRAYKVDLSDCIHECIVDVSNLIQTNKLSSNTPFILTIHNYLKRRLYESVSVSSISFDDAEVKAIYNQDNVCFDKFVAINILRERLYEIIEQALTNREREVLELRFGLKDGRMKTLEEVAVLLGTTRERIRQVEAKALRRLRSARDVRLHSISTDVFNKIND